MYVHEIFRQVADQLADHVAICAGDRAHTYAELEVRSNSIGNFFVNAGASHDSVIVILSADPLSMIPTIIGVLKAGCVFVPIDPATPPGRLEVLLAAAAPEWIVTEVQYLPLLDAIGAAGERRCNVVCVDAPGAIVVPERIHYVADYQSYTNSSRLVVARPPDALCYLYFTSGSTGRPKGIAGRLKAIDHFVRWEIEALDVGVGTRVSQLTTPAFDAFLRDVFTPLCAGGTVCVPPSRGTVLDAQKLVRWLDEQRIELLHCVPSLFRAMLNEHLEPHLFASLKYVAMAGEPLLPADVKRWMDVFGERVQLVNLYGPSETTMTKFVHFVQPADRERRSVPIGKPMDGARAMILHARGQPCPPGTIGEIYIRTPFCSLGYYRQPELTKEVFLQNPYSDDPHDIIYKTGDFGRLLEDGSFELLGRRDQQVKIRGVRIELGEIENVLRSHESVLDVAVVDREETPGHTYLCAYIVLSEPGDIDHVRAFATAMLPAAMIPAIFMPLEALPRTLTGKVDRRALLAPAERRSRQGQTTVAPRTPVEAVLASIWTQALGVKHIGVHDNFFELGGHSLLATQVLARAYDAFQVEIPLQRLLIQPTIAGLAENVETAMLHVRGFQPPALEPVSRREPLPLSFAQQQLWTLDRLQPGTPAYNMASVVRLTGHLDAAALAQSIQAVVRRHESLRTTFPLDAHPPRQVVVPELKIPLQMVDLHGMAAGDREARVQQLATQESQQPFDLARGPLVRTTLLRLDDTTHVLLLTVHHIVADTRSLGIFLREIVAGYEAALAGTAAQLPALSIQYADFAAWLRRWVQGEYLEAQLRYWQQALAGAPPLLTLPTDRPRPVMQSLHGKHLGFDLSPELTSGLKQLSQQEGATLFMTLLTAFKTLLYRYSNQSDIVVGTPMANRYRTELEGVIGFFADVLVLRSNLSGNPSFAAFLRQVRQRTMEAYDHRSVPFERLADVTGHQRDPSYNPLFQVMFSFEDGPIKSLDAAGVSFEPIFAESGVAKFDLFLALALDGDALSGVLEYSTDLFDPASMTQLVGNFKTLLHAIVAHPQTPISQLPLMSVHERSQVLVTSLAAQRKVRADDLQKRLAKLLDERRKSS